MTGTKKFAALVVSLMLVLTGSVALAPAANAHVSTCMIAPKAPVKYGPQLLRAKGQWYCEVSSHHSFVVNATKVEVKVKPAWSPVAFWYGIPPEHKSGRSTRKTGTTIATVGCIKGTKTYRTVQTLDMYGAHGTVRKTKTSGQTTVSC